MIEIFFDGLCEPNPHGRGGIGALIQKDGEIINTISDYIGKGKHMTNNVAEYEALRRALTYLKATGLSNEQIIIYGDSKLVIEQMRGNWKVKNGVYKDRALEVFRKVQDFNAISFKWIPREKNAQADELSKLSIKGRE